MTKTISQSPLWILQPSPLIRTRLRKALEAITAPRFFVSVRDLEFALENDSRPLLVIADPNFSQEDVQRIKNMIERGQFPVIVYSADQDRNVIFEMLNLGARDYFLKSAPLVLLQAKVEVLLGNKNPEKLGKLDLTISSRTFGVTTPCGTKIKLTNTEFQVFMVLYEAYPSGVKREKMDQSIWTETKVIRKTLDVHIFKLRKKLEPLGLGVQFCEDRRYQLKKLTAPPK